MWIIQGIVSKGDYIYAKVPDHPNATVLGYVFHHRIIMENKLGRLLTSEEIVHHKNHDKRDNSVDNLQVMDRIEHMRMHGYEQGVLTCLLECPQCKCVFERSYRQAFQTAVKKYGVFCSRSCSGKFSRKAQLDGLSEEMQSAVDNNLIDKYTVYSR
jgi:hypothetical protein